MLPTSEKPDDRKGLYAVDIREFFVMITIVMVLGFVAGVKLAESSAGRTTIVRSSRADVYDSFVEHSPNRHPIDDWEEEENLPAGQHLLVDIEGVDEDFLNSEERLSKAMVDTVKEAGLHMLSYHCHSLLPAGVSCVGVLLESHVSFHTWPSEGVITLDLFTCGSKPLLPVVATIERLFGIPSSKKSNKKIHTQWSHELRGFRPAEELKRNYLADSSDLSLWVLSPLNMYSKKQVYSGHTKFQQVDIWDIVQQDDTPSYTDILKHNLTPGDPRVKNPEYITPDRLLFLEGIVQSVTSSERIYHEALVHPAMFAHPGPARVVILGGGEGATLREVLKHKTVESAVMVEIDEELVQISRQHLPSFSNCSDLVGCATNCFDDERATLFYQDGRQWFIDRYGCSPTKTPEHKDYDVVIVDALDPEEESEISDLLYNDESFLESLVNSLSEKGVLVVQVGTAATIDDPRPDLAIYRREPLFNWFESNPKVETMLVYEEPHAGYLEPHSFLIVCRSADCRSRWYARNDQVEYEIYNRIVRTHSRKRALTYFDGITQRSYQWPKKGWETVYCRREPTPFECACRTMDSQAQIYEFNLADDESSSFRVEAVKDENDEIVSKVFARKNISKGSFIMPNHLASSLMITSRNYQGLQSNLNVGGGRVAIIADLLEFFEEYAHKSPGNEQHYIEVGASVLIRRTENDDDPAVNVGRWLPAHPSGKRPIYSPVYERHRVAFDVFLVATKDIAEGEELVMKKSSWVEK